ncbi:sugar ABC transporter permease [Paenibacillus sp. PAMC21692]|uniref:ABC transporter permease n=1 Tax=Paenibacillus sp. PAMC21692 TaxID=2762320 RepID=UPI00164E250C|nr:ABC transporter permease subunit [Paenibacillus sp. PAMC21692]QNK56564.1 sugar ABC transporter permease [Paenibacillus sp. PAMC21692]
MAYVTNRKRRQDGFLREMMRNKMLYLMTVPGIAFFLIFNYVPMYGLLIAFKSYNIQDGIFGSPWIGLKNFEFYFKSIYAAQTTFNTLFLNGLFIGIGLVVQVTIAILLNEIGSAAAKKWFQSALFFPYFLSWIIVSAFVYNLLSDHGTLNSLLESMNLPTVAWFNETDKWRMILVLAYLWKSTGFFVVVYLAAIVGIDSELYEAAKIDGTNRFQSILYVTLPGILPTIVIMLLLSIGRIFYGDFLMIYSLVGDNGMLLPVTDVIDTYVFRAMRVSGEFGMATAVGLYQAVLGFALVSASNFLVKKYDKDMALY